MQRSDAVQDLLNKPYGDYQIIETVNGSKANFTVVVKHPTVDNDVEALLKKYANGPRANTNVEELAHNVLAISISVDAVENTTAPQFGKNLDKTIQNFKTFAPAPKVAVAKSIDDGDFRSVFGVLSRTYLTSQSSYNIILRYDLMLKQHGLSSQGVLPSAPLRTAEDMANNNNYRRHGL